MVTREQILGMLRGFEAKANVSILWIDPTHRLTTPQSKTSLADRLCQHIANGVNALLAPEHEASEAEADYLQNLEDHWDEPRGVTWPD